MMINLPSRFIPIILFGIVPGLTSCAYTVDKAYQDVKFMTVGAEYAQCDVYVDKLRYQVNPPQTINIMKSDEVMEIRCIAPGNRMQTLKVPADFESKSLAGGPVGMAWDYASQSMFAYPSVIAIDFSLEKNTPFPLPRHNAPDITQPEEYDLEEYLPGEPRLNSDRTRHQEPIRRKDDVARDAENVRDTPIDEPKQINQDKASLQKAAHKLNDSSSIMPTPLDGPALEDERFSAPSGSSLPAPPKVEIPKAGVSKPVKLYPGE